MRRSFGDHEVEVLFGHRRILGAAGLIEAHRQASGLGGQVLASVEWFLAKRKVWRDVPIAVLSRRDGVLEGVALLHYSKAFGIPYGVVSGGVKGAVSAIAPVDKQHTLLETAARFLVHHNLAHTVVATVPSPLSAAEQSRATRQTPEVRWYERADGCRLNLTGGFDATLQRLGYKLRRNVRHYRRLAEEEKLRFVPELSLAQRQDAVAALFHKGRYPTPRHRARLWEQTLQEVPGAFAVGLQTAAGEWISYLAGWREACTTYIDWQLNDERSGHNSTGTAARAYLLEHEAQRASPSLVFVGGTSAIWSRACEPTAASDLIVTHPGPVARAMQQAFRTLRPESDAAVLAQRALDPPAAAASPASHSLQS